ncbi:RNA-binding S4 domain-containing protein [Abyssisolibacter fermentans]|uniref:RNA-binding S4 domain-containing protein n=1 Tax=Abyssisolibacter fermentans TaxID=1766203 RepID=UPI00082E2AF5|nr:RNA-binding S4 domain-containing protein [Abyssisolibacter fermentans]
MRIDKFLKNSRIIKRRTLAKEACEKGRVLINDKEVKPGAEVTPGDIIEVIFGNKTLKVEVIELLEHVTKDDAHKLYKIL